MSLIVERTITETFLRRVKESPAAVAFRYRPHLSSGPGPWKAITCSEFYLECRDIAFGLMHLGVKPGDRVAILSGTRYEWSLSDMAILGSGAVTVPIYTSHTPDDVLYILNHSEAKIALLEDARQLEKLYAKLAEDPKALPHLETVILMDSPRPDEVIDGVREPGQTRTFTFEQLRRLGREEQSISKASPGRFNDLLSAAKPDDLITICYTSGTSGVPKGAMITHANMMSVLEDCAKVLAPHLNPEEEVLLSFLPFSHILGKVESMAIWVFGWQEAFAESVDRLMSNLLEIRPTLIFAVPRTFEKAYSLIRYTAEHGSLASRKLFSWATETGTRYFDEIRAGRSPSLRLYGEYNLARNLVFKNISDRFGGRLKFAICGGAPLPREVGEFFQNSGFAILEGYGLTETCAPVSLNTLDHLKIGSVGRPLPEVTLRIAEDGEILVHSRKVFKGYYKMPEETAEALQDDWLHTGDIGTLDKEGFLYVTDRKKDIIITSGGKNIAPQKIENLVKAHKLINQFVVHGDNRNYLTALVTLDQEQVIRYATEHSILFSEYSELVKNPRIITLVQRIIDEINRRLASYETIKKFIILPRDFSIDRGELTPSLKVRRRLISERYRDLLDTMYESRNRPKKDLPKALTP